MKRVIAIALMLAVLGWTVPARAVIGTIDQVPAATLLLPYFEVNLDDANGVQTLFSINNASASAALAHVTIWSDLSVPVLIFDVYLTGYDVQTINLRDIFVDGKLPQTASVGQDPKDTISPQGDISQDINFASCTGILPLPTLQQISASTGFDYIQHVQSSLTGGPSAVLQGKCAGQPLGDRIARGYVTIDSTNACTTNAPGAPGYFVSGGGAIAGNRNILWGDFFYVNSAQNFAQGETLVHIEASATDPATSVPGRYTFYGRYTDVPWNAADNREPLSTNFAARFLNGGAFTGGTSLVVWRDSKTNQQAFTCPASQAAHRPPWYPLSQEALVAFDEQENPNVTASFPTAPQDPAGKVLPFPAEANRVKVGGPNFPVPFTFGWIYANLNTTVTGNPNPTIDPAAAQAWMTTIHDAEGRFSVGYNATLLDSAVQALHFTPGP